MQIVKSNSLLSRLASLLHKMFVVFLTFVHRIYKITLSPFFGPCCRFWPPCSDYALQAITQHGVRRGSWLAVCRVVKCHPWCEGGIDPVPANSIVSEK